MCPSCAPVATAQRRSTLSAMSNRDNANGNALHASGSQLWRANSLGLLEIRQSPGDPIPRVTRNC